MNVKSIERNGNEATIVVEIDKELMESGVNKAYMKARKQIMIPGFRKGKAPRKMIEAMYGAHVFYEDGLEEIFPEVYEFAVVKQDLKAIGRPSLTDMHISEENIVTLTLTTEVYPEVTLGQYKGLEIEKAEATVTDEQVQAELDRMLQNVASTETVEKAAEMGDTANIDFEGFDNGVPFDGGKGDNFDLKLGSGQFVPGFEEQIVGKNIGDEFDVVVTFPTNYQMTDYAGKEAVFKTKLHAITFEELPEIDDELIKDATDFDTVEEYKADIRKQLEEAAEKQAEAAYENALLSALIEKVDSPIPNCMFEQRIDEIVASFERQLKQQGMSLKLYCQYTGMDEKSIRDTYRERAEGEVKLRLALEKIAELEALEVSEEEIENSLSEIAAANNMDIATVRRFISVDEYTTDLKVQKAIDFVKENAVIDNSEAEEAASDSADEE